MVERTLQASEIDAIAFRAEISKSPEILSGTARRIGGIFKACLREEPGQTPLVLPVEAQKRLASTLVSLSWRQIPEAYETAISTARTVLDFSEQLDPQVQRILFESMQPKKIRRGDFDSVVRQVTDETLSYSRLETAFEYNIETRQITTRVDIGEKMGEPLAEKYGQMFLSWIALRYPASQNIKMSVTTDLPAEYSAEVRTGEFLDLYYKKELGTIS